MAYANDPNKKEEAQPTQDQPNALPTTSSAPGAGPGASGGKTAQTPQSAPRQPFQNLQAYLSANQPQVQAQAEKTAGQLESQYGQTQGAIDQAKTQYGEQVKAGYTPANEELVNQAVSNPTEFVSKPENIKAFQSLYNDQYTGPGNFETSDTYGNLASQVNKATEQANLVNTIPGLQTYYQGQNPNATKGGNVLDAVLMQGSPEAFSKVTDAAKKFGSLQDYLSGATTDVNKAIQDAKAQATATSTGLQNKFTGEGGLIPTFQNELTGRVTQSQKEAQDRAKSVQDFIALLNQGMNLSETNPATGATEQQLKDLGLTNEEISKLFKNKSILDFYKSPSAAGLAVNGIPYSPYQGNLSLTDYLTTQNPQAQLTKENLATKEEYDRAAALAQLTGQDLTGTLNPNDISKAGTGNLDVSDFNRNALTDYQNTVNEENRRMASYLGNNIDFSSMSDAEVADWLTNAGGFGRRGVNI